MLYSSLIHPKDRGWVNERYWGVYRGENGGRYEAEYRILRADDRVERWVHNTGLVRFATQPAARSGPSAR